MDLSPGRVVLSDSGSREMGKKKLDSNSKIDSELFG
jgi:hypothetical protein